MGTYLRGNNLTIVQRFYTVDPITRVSTPADPTAVVFSVTQPDGTTVAYVFGVDGNVTNPEVGLYLCELATPLPTGYYTWRATGTGAVVAANEGSFQILESGTILDGVPEVAEYGPCQQWINAEDVLALCAETAITDANAYLFDSAASIGSSAMWDLTGRQFDGVCERTVRPCTTRCGCFGVGVMGLGPWYWGGGFGYGLGAPLSPSGGWWFNECGDSCGCGYVPTVRLPGYPVREIREVKIGGEVVDPDTYRLDRRRELVRLSTPTDPRFWPSCQDLTLDDSEPGTFSVRYLWGAGVPELAKQAAAQIACEIYKNLNGDPCRLPSGATKVVRQGITIDRITNFAQFFRTGATGLPLVDLAIATFNPSAMRRRPAVFSPDLQQFGRQVR